ncbi:MAG: hypothetical protein O7G84_13610 [Gammaproteobacteria bacterium]|nr:hypothetical protein [Gammaproteobacteria bacterium]
MSRPSAQALIYMQAWKSGIAGSPFDLTVIPEWLLGAAERGHDEGVEARKQQWLVARGQYPHDFPETE